MRNFKPIYLATVVSLLLQHPQAWAGRNDYRDAFLYGMGARALINSVRSYQNSRSGYYSSDDSSSNSYNNNSSSYEEEPKPQEVTIDQLANPSAKPTVSSKPAVTKPQAPAVVRNSAAGDAPETSEEIAPLDQVEAQAAVDCNCETDKGAGAAKIQAENIVQNLVSHTVNVVTNIKATPFNVSCSPDGERYQALEVAKFSMLISTYAKSNGRGGSAAGAAPGTSDTTKYNRNSTMGQENFLGLSEADKAKRSKETQDFIAVFKGAIDKKVAALENPGVPTEINIDFNKDVFGADESQIAQRIKGMLEVFMPAFQYKLCAIQSKKTGNFTYIK